jgi:hypothetical protein
MGVAHAFEDGRYLWASYLFSALRDLKAKAARGETLNPLWEQRTDPRHERERGVVLLAEIASGLDHSRKIVPGFHGKQTALVGMFA